MRNQVQSALSLPRLATRLARAVFAILCSTWVILHHHMQHPSISTSPSKMQASPLTWPTYPLKHVFLIGANGFVASHTLSHSSSALQLISALSNDPKRKLTKHPPTSQHPSSRLSLAIVPGTTAPAPFCLRIREHGSTLQRSHTHHVAIRVWHRVLKREVPGASC